MERKLQIHKSFIEYLIESCILPDQSTILSMTLDRQTGMYETIIEHPQLIESEDYVQIHLEEVRDGIVSYFDASELDVPAGKYVATFKSFENGIAKFSDQFTDYVATIPEDDTENFLTELANSPKRSKHNVSDYVGRLYLLIYVADDDGVTFLNTVAQIQDA